MTLKKFNSGEAHVSNAHNALQTHPVARLTQQKKSDSRNLTK